MWFIDLLFASSEKPRYSFLLSKTEAHHLLSQIVLEKFVFGEKISSQIIDYLKTKPETAKLIFSHDFKSQLRETELAKIIETIYQGDFISHYRFKTSSQAVRYLLQTIKNTNKPAPPPPQPLPPKQDYLPSYPVDDEFKKF